MVLIDKMGNLREGTQVRDTHWLCGGCERRLRAAVVKNV